MTPEVKSLVEHKIALRSALSQVLSSEVVDYILSLISQDLAHQKLMNL